MSSYISRPGYSYKAYLQDKSFVEDIRWDISKANLNLVATKEALEKHGVRVEESLARGFDKTTQSLERVQEITKEGFDEVAGRLGEVDRTLGEGFVTLHSDLLSIEGSVKDLSARFDWGITRLEMAVGGVSDSLDDLIRISRSPEQTWAYEQFALAHEALRRKLIPESLEHVLRAINGYQGHTGHKLEHRFHHLLGILYGTCAETHALGKASEAYLNAARYAETDYKFDAAMALCAAGNVAYVQDDFQEAEARTRRGLAFSEFPAANYQLAKIIIRQHRVEEALTYFVKALRRDPLYSLLRDDEFLAHKKDVMLTINNERDRLRADFKRCAIMLAQQAKTAHAALTEREQIASLLPDSCVQALKQHSSELVALGAEADVTSAQMNNSRLPYVDVYNVGMTINKWPTRLGHSVSRIRDQLQRGIDFLKSNPFEPAPPASAIIVPNYYSSGVFMELLCRAVLFVIGLIVILAAGDTAPGILIGLSILAGAWLGGELLADLVERWINAGRVTRANRESNRQFGENEALYNQELAAANERLSLMRRELLALDNELQEVKGRGIV